MSDTTNDIDALQSELMKAREDGGWFITVDQAKDFSRALTALVAERDALKIEAQNAKTYWRALAEANEIAARYKRERDEARRKVCYHIAVDTVHYIGTHGYPCSKGPSAMQIAAEFGWDCFNEGVES